MGFKQGMGEVKSGLSQTSKEIAKLDADFQRKMGGDFVRTLQSGSKSVRALGADFLQTASNAGVGGAQIEAAAGSMGIFSRGQLAAAKSSADLAIETDRLVHQMKNGEITAQEAGRQFGLLATNAQAGGVSIQQMGLKFAAAAAVIGVAVAGIRAGFDFARQGAELDYASVKFGRLAEQAGSLSRVMLGDLREATRGLYSDAELMGSAGDFMALGLAKTHDEAVRLASVAGALNMNMNQLVLTLTNQTTMRFDALGVSVDGFKERVEALEAAGLSANEAFSEAFLQQAEAQIEKVGHAADTALGSFMRLGAQSDNFWNNLKTQAASALQPVVGGLADQFEAANKANEAMRDLGASITYTQMEGLGLVRMYQLSNGELLTLEEMLLRAYEAHRLSNFETERAARLHEMLQPELEETGDGLDELSEAARKFADEFLRIGKSNPLQDLLDIDSAAMFHRMGGDVLAGLVEQIKSDVAAAGGVIDENLAGNIEHAAIEAAALQVALGNITAEEAVETLGQLSVPIKDAQSRIQTIASVLKGLDGAEFNVTVNVNGMPRNHYNVQATQSIKQQATGGPFDPNGLTLVGERGAELIANGYVYTSEETRKMLPMLQAMGMLPRGLATGGALGSGGGNAPWTPRGADLIANGAGSYRILPATLLGLTNDALGNAGYGPPASGRGGNAPRSGRGGRGADESGADAQAAAVAVQAAVQAAQAAAYGVGASVASSTSQATQRAISEFTRKSNQDSMQLMAAVEKMTKAVLSLPYDIAKEVSHELALRVG